MSRIRATSFPNSGRSMKAKNLAPRASGLGGEAVRPRASRPVSAVWAPSLPGVTRRINTALPRQGLNPARTSRLDHVSVWNGQGGWRQAVLLSETVAVAERERASAVSVDGALPGRTAARETLRRRPATRNTAAQPMSHRVPSNSLWGFSLGSGALQAAAPGSGLGSDELAGDPASLTVLGCDWQPGSTGLAEGVAGDAEAGAFFEGQDARR